MFVLNAFRKIISKLFLLNYSVLIFLILGWTAKTLAVEKVFIPSSMGQQAIEVYFTKPSQAGPRPALLLVHPEQDSPKIGGEMFVKTGQLDFWAEKGYVAMAASQPGYGQSGGKPDFCGPRTQQAIIDVIGYFRKQNFVNPKLFFVYGGSRGAVVASMVATHDLDLRGVILKSGIYDFISWIDSRSWFDPIRLTMVWEIGFLNEFRLRERSAFYQADKIKVPVLVIHGIGDDRAPIGGAESFTNKIISFGGRADLIKVDSGHVIPMTQVNDTIEQFMKRNGDSVPEDSGILKPRQAD